MLKELALTLLAVSSLAPAQIPSKDAARTWISQHGGVILTEFEDLLRIPNVAADPSGLRANADKIRSLYEMRGVTTKLLQIQGAPPVVYGERRSANAKQTVVFYAHYDGQPVDPKEWRDSGPFEPLLRSDTIDRNGRRLLAPTPELQLDPEWRIYARSAADDKAPIIAMLAALDALQAAGIEPTVNLKFVFEGEEESGSKNLSKILSIDRGLLKADFWLICDGPVHQTRAQQLYFGARGMSLLELTVYGPLHELHSGHYGNWVPNPAMRLAQLLASMKNDEGRVLIKGFYDGAAPLSPAEKKALAAEPEVERTLMDSFAIAGTDNPGRRLSDTLTEPSLNVRGLRSADVGPSSRNVIPSEATASLDMRLVKGNDWRAMNERLITHITNQGYFVVDHDPSESERRDHLRVAKLVSTGGYNAVRTPMDGRASLQVIAAVEKVHGPVVKIPTMGGSVPLSYIDDIVHVPLIGVPVANHDSNQHSSNENLKLKNLWDGIETFAALFTMEAR
jgi:acetylornithine deacetylase/succinyl-diaminopimelate desuccinylase-like protein